MVVNSGMMGDDAHLALVGGKQCLDLVKVIVGGCQCSSSSAGRHTCTLEKQAAGMIEVAQCMHACMQHAAASFSVPISVLCLCSQLVIGGVLQTCLMIGLLAWVGESAYRGNLASPGWPRQSQP